MTKILIKKMSYKHFKGIESFELDLNGSAAVVTGRNGAGKTTLADGLQWLLFGKDSQGAKINPKPLDKNNNELLGLEPTVEAELYIDGKQVMLKRVQQERWTTKKGELDKTRGSDTTKYFIDTVPTKEKDWKDYIQELGGETNLQMLSNSSFFMNLNWKDRRETLIGMTGLTDEEIIASDPTLKELPLVLKDHTINEMKKIIAGQKTEVKKSIEGMPARIQEVTDMRSQLGLPDSKASLEKNIDEMSLLIKEKESWLVDAKAGNVNKELNDLTEKQANLRAKLIDEKTKFQTTVFAATSSLQEDFNKQHEAVSLLRTDISKLESEEYRQQEALKEKREFLEKHLEKYKSIKAETFDDHQTVCPTCNQDLPTEKIEEIKSDFNQQQSEKLEKNIEVGKATRQDADKLEVEIKKLQTSLSEKRTAFKAAESQLDKINNDLIYEKNKQGKFEESQVYKDIIAENTQLEVEMEKAKQKDSNSEVEKLEADIESDKSILACLQKDLQKFETADSYDKRLSELKYMDKSFKEQNQQIEKDLWLLEEFTRKKVERIEESINAKFEIVKWKLFDVQKNEGIKEMCEATFNGVEYNAGLNNGARINCDLDIVNTLSRELGITMPLFIDNAESVNTLIPIQSQMIELQVTADEKLKVEV
ncbi:ATP-binding protein [Candidatus Enterococcus ferrettii]|uniref:Rad50/SbcC-type AAA domain-containing protein n=1 Tax=Candidatus Enterococcus ferrettii TaxID=2815324 RepID=A0ABV0EKP9_9ENTE|nr:ATP-binding protein [Enterococcus sp. 665A]MBO1341851.1 AAA family ATPase [Enterococcus sp. 665A]